MIKQNILNPDFRCSGNYIQINSPGISENGNTSILFKGDPVWDGEVDVNGYWFHCNDYYFPSWIGNLYSSGSIFEYNFIYYRFICCGNMFVTYTDSTKATLSVYDPEYGKMEFDCETFMRLDALP